MNEKWSALVNAPVDPPASVAPVLTADILEKSTSNIVPMTVAFFLLAVTAIIVVSFILSRSKQQRPNKLAAPKLVAPKVAEEPEQPQDAAVEAKAAGEGPSEAGPTAFLEANGLTFDDFQMAFQHGREKPVVDRAPGSSKAFMHVLDELEALKPTLAAQGQTFQDYIDAHNMKVPDALLDLWTSGNSGYDESMPSEWPPEAMMLAREALQPVSVSMDPEAASAILREILAARTEAGRSDIKLPPLPSDQEAGLRHWAKSPTKAGELAKTILSRF